MTPALLDGSLAARYVAGSALVRWWQAPAAETDVFAGSVVWRWAGSRWVVMLLGLLSLGMIWQGALSGVLLAGLVILAWRFPMAATALLPLALVSSWRVSLGGTADEAVFVRPSDALLAGALFRTAGQRLTGVGAGMSLVGAGVVVVLVIALSALLGWVRGTLPAPQAAVLLIVQWGTLLGTFFLALAYGTRLGRWGLLAWAAAVCGVAGFGIAESLSPLAQGYGEYRSFERLWFDGQANHYGGLFAFAVYVGAGMFLHPEYRAAGLVLALLAAMGLGTTRSDSSLVAMVAGLGAVFALRFPILLGLAVFAPLSLLVIPFERLESITLPGSSMHDRLVAWKSALSTVAAYPLLGLGGAARHRSFYDNHYVMALAETGMAGLLAWLYWLACMAKTLWHSMRGAEIRRWCLTAGTTAGWAALCVHALANISFVVTVVAGPALWWTGYVLSREEST